MTTEEIYAIPANENGWRKLPNGNYVSLGSDVRLGDGVRLGNYVRLGNGVRLGNYVRLGNDVRLGSDVRLGNGVRLGDGSIVEAPALEVRMDWGPAVAAFHKDGEWRISVGCRFFTYDQALLHWASRDDRAISRRILEFMREEAIARGWESAA